MIKILPTLGERVATAIRENLLATRRTWAQLRGADVAAIVDAMPEAQKPGKEAKTRAGRVKALATDEEWLKSLESDPALSGVDVRQELGKAQFWCGQRRRECSRQFFTNWLLKAEKTVTVNGANRSSFAAAEAKKPGFPEPSGWRAWINANRPESVYAEGNVSCNLPWHQLDYTAKKYIREQMGIL